MGYVDVLPSGRFRGIARVNGRRKTVGTFEYEHEALLAIEDAEGRLQPTEAAGPITVAAFAYIWADGRAGGWTPSTRATNATTVRFLQTDPLGALDVEDVKLGDIDRAMTRWSVDGAKTSTIYQRFRIVRAILNYAHANGRRSLKAPTEGASLPDEKGTGDARGQWLEPDRVDALTDAAKEVGPIWHALVVAMHDAGLRVGEALALTPDALTGSSLHIFQVIDRKTGKVRDYTKDHDDRDIPLTAKLRAVLAPFVLAADGERSLLFTQDNGRPITYDMWRHRLPGIRRRAKLTRTRLPITAHDFRHTFITNMLAKGVPTPIVQGWAGHEDEQTTKKYDHGVPSATAAAWMRFAAEGAANPNELVGS